MLNHITLMGRLTAPPELKQTSSGTNYTRFVVAVDGDYGKGDEKKTDFVSCVAWRKTAEFISKYFSKGSLAIVSGRLESSKYVKTDGENRTDWSVNIEHIYFGEKKQQGNTVQNNARVTTGVYVPYEEPATAPQPVMKLEDLAQYENLTFVDISETDGDLPF